MSDIKTVGVIGAGQMGAGIAQVCAAAGHQTILWDAVAEGVDRGLQGIRAQLGKAVEKQKLTAADAEATLGRISKGKVIADLSRADLVIEAITENLEVKTKLFRELDGLVGKSCFLASNTSSISITKLASATSRPERFIGLHFMNPVPVMKLVEMIRGLQTSDETFATCKGFIEKLGKLTVVAKDSPGFIVNRILAPMLNEAFFLLQEGLAPQDIDNGMLHGTNQPMGPLALADFIGLDTCLAILQVLHRELGEDKYRPCPVLVKYVEAGWLGKKTKRGVYAY